MAGKRVDVPKGVILPLNGFLDLIKLNRQNLSMVYSTKNPNPSRPKAGMDALVQTALSIKIFAIKISS